MSSKSDTLITPPARDIRGLVRSLRLAPTQSRLVGGSLVMLAGSMTVSVLNFGYNMVVARMLGKAAFGQAAAAVTVQLIISALTLSFQIVCAKFVAKNETLEQKSYTYRSLLRRSWMIGLSVGLTILVFSIPAAKWLQMSSPWTLVALAVGMTFYVPVGVKRGGLQGVCHFRQLSWNFVLETIVKMVAAVVLLYAGFGILGAVAAISISTIAAYIYPRVPDELRKQPVEGVPASFGEGVQAVIFFVGQVVINNMDILLVNHFFRPEVAGLYAAVALIGRVLYIASWQVVSAMFPIAAGKKDPNEKESWTVIGVPLGLVTAISLGFIGVVGLAPDFVLRVLFGAKFQISGTGVDNLLMLRTVATAGYGLSVVLMTYEMSRRIANTGWFQLAVAGLIVVGISLFHNTLQQVILLQQVLMGVLLIVVAGLFLRSRLSQHRGAAA